MSERCWSTLGIQPTNSQRDIKKAYAQLVKKHHPEDDPAGFQKANEAYQRALELAKQLASNDAQEPGQSLAKIAPLPENEDIDEQVSTDVEEVETAQELRNNELEQLTNTLSNAFYELIQDPNTRNNPALWADLLDDEQLNSFDIKQAVGLHVFAAFAEHLESDNAAFEGSFIQRNIVKQVAKFFHWQDRELEFEHYCDYETMDRLMYLAYGSKAVADSGAQKSGWKSKLKGLTMALFWLLALSALIRFFTFKLEKLDLVNKAPTHQEQLVACNRLKAANNATSLKHCGIAAERGELSAQRALAAFYLQSKDAAELATGRKWLAKAAQQDSYLDVLQHLIILATADFPEDAKHNARNKVIELAQDGNIHALVYWVAGSKLGHFEPIPDITALEYLHKAHNTDQRVLSIFALIASYVNGYFEDTDLSKAALLLKDYAETQPPVSLNNTAWYAVTTESSSFIDNAFALYTAEQAVQQASTHQRHMYEDTLAAALAADGRFDEAVDMQLQAIRSIRTSSLTYPRVQKTEEDFRTRLERYKNSTPLERAPIIQEEKLFFTNLSKRIENQLIRYLRAK